MQWFFPLVRRTVRTDVTCAGVVVSRAERTETGNIEDNAADGAFLGSGFLGRLLCYGTSIIISNGFHNFITAILAYRTIKATMTYRFYFRNKTTKKYREY
jgi:hypothetical protein